MENPRTRSSSAPVANWRMCERVTFPLCLAVKRIEMGQTLASLNNHNINSKSNNKKKRKKKQQFLTVFVQQFDWVKPHVQHNLPTLRSNFFWLSIIFIAETTIGIHVA